MKTNRTEINKSTIRDFKIHLSTINKTTRQKVSKYIQENSELTTIYKPFHPTKAEYTFFSCIHRKYSKTAYILSHKTSHKFKRIEIIECFLTTIE